MIQRTAFGLILISALFGVIAADALIASFQEGGRIRIGIVSFSGEMNPDTGRRKRFDQQDGWVEVPLTTDFAAARGDAARRQRSVAARTPRREIAGRTPPPRARRAPWAARRS